MSQHESADFLQKKATAKRLSKAVLTSNLVALITNNNEDDLYSNTHFGMVSHSFVDIETDFDINDGYSIKSIAHLQEDENKNGNSEMPSLFHNTHDDSSIESISLVAIPHLIYSSCTNSNDVSVDASQSMPRIAPHVPNDAYISNGISLNEDVSEISKKDDASSSDDSSAAKMPRIFAGDYLLDDVTVSSGDISSPFHLFNVYYNDNHEDENIIDDNLPFPDNVSISTLVPELHHYDDQDALVVHFILLKIKISPLNQKISYYHYGACS